MDIMANDAVFLTNIVGFHRFHLVGVSMGGMIAQHVALLVPEVRRRGEERRGEGRECRGEGTGEI